MNPSVYLIQRYSDVDSSWPRNVDEKISEKKISEKHGEKLKS